MLLVPRLKSGGQRHESERRKYEAATATKINIGPPVLTINHGSTFMVTDLNGEIAADSEQGVFARDTRFVSYYAIFANGIRWTRLTSSPLTYYGARIYLTNRAFSTRNGDVPGGTLALVISRAASQGIHEDLDVSNHGLKQVRFKPRSGSAIRFC